MKTKNIELKWYVLNHDFNTDEIINYNIFCAWSMEDLKKEYKAKRVHDKETLKDYIDRWARRYFWCRVEAEILVTGMVTRKEETPTKVDIYRQIEMNLDQITDYVNSKIKLY